MIDFKNEKGAITLYIIVVLLFVIISIGSVQANLKSKEARVESEYQKIKMSYEKDVSEVYNSSEITIKELKASLKAVNTTIIIEEDDGDIITIPESFKVSPDSGDTVEEGIVVIAPDGSEFVWVPVPHAIYDGITEIKVGTKDTEGVYTPMARLQTGTTNYQGIAYNLNQAVGSQKIYDFTTYGVGTTKCREPSLVTGNEQDTYAILENIQGTKYDNGTNTTTNKKYYELVGDYGSAIEFGKDMQDEYNNMVKSVNKYKGFYVGRYETGIENGKAVSKNAYTNENVITADASLNEIEYWWYGLYKKQRTMATDNNYTKVESSMIWGSQYDAMMNWMINTGNIVGTGYDETKWTSAIKVTGQSEIDIINKVYDLYGCHYEWSLEAYDSTGRIGRGGYYGAKNSPSYRGYSEPTYLYELYGSRLTLYVKDTNTEDTTIPVETVTINGETKVGIGEKIQLEAEILPENATNKTVTWISSDQSIATVDNTGNVTGASDGTVTITATVDGVSAIYTVQVGKLITFTIDGIQYKVLDGTTWEQWATESLPNEFVYSTKGSYILLNGKYVVGGSSATLQSVTTAIESNIYSLSTNSPFPE